MKSRPGVGLPLPAGGARSKVREPLLLLLLRQRGSPQPLASTGVYLAPGPLCPAAGSRTIDAAGVG